MDFLTRALIHAAPVLLVAGLALFFSCAGSKAASSPLWRPSSRTPQVLLLIALSALALGAWRSGREYLFRRSPNGPIAPAAVTYTPTYMPPLSAPYALNLSCALADGSRGTCSPSFCSSLASAAATTPACTGGTAALTTAVDPAAYLAKVKAQTCTVSSDARCTTAALTKMFGALPSVYAAYCNSAYLVLVTSTDPGYAENLDNVVYPPGGTNAGGTACRTRSASIGAVGMHTKRVLLSPTLLASASLSNNLNWFTSTYNYITDPANKIIPLPVDGAVGFTLSGQDVFPIYNNRGGFTPEQCESDGCNAHVGQGGGAPHLHGDPFGPWCFYGPANYTSLLTHPPQIGYAVDGHAIFGRHLSTSAVGYSDALDICGGHTHDGLLYHYHTQVLSTTTTAYAANGISSGQAYPASTPGVYQCYRGNLSADALLLAKGSDGDAAVSVCTGATSYYVRPGCTLPGVAAQPTASGTISTSPTPTASGSTSASPTPTISASPTLPPIVTANGTLALDALPATAFTSAGAPTTATLTALTSALTTSVATVCTTCTVAIKKIVDVASGATIFGARRLATYGKLSVTYSVSGSAAQVSAATTAPSAAFTSAVVTQLASAGMSGAVVAPPAAPSSPAAESSVLALGLGLGLGLGLAAIAAIYAIFCCCPKAQQKAVASSTVENPATGSVRV